MVQMLANTGKEIVLYGTASTTLPVTGAAAFSLMGYQFGVVQIMIVALGMMAAGTVLYRQGTRGQRHATAVSR